MKWASNAVREQLVRKILMSNLVERLGDIQSNGPTLILSVKNSTNALNEVGVEITNIIDREYRKPYCMSDRKCWSDQSAQTKRNQENQ